MPDDTELLRRYAATRAEDAFAELVRRHLDGVYSAALRRVGGDTHFAEDVAQQVFVALARKAGRLSRHPVLAGWLHAATRHEAAKVVRYERRRKTREQEAQAMHDINSAAAPEADWSRVAPVLDEALDRLTELDRTAVLLRYVERRPFGEIADALRLTEDAARMRVNRALDKLRALLARRGIVSTSAALSLVLTNHAVAAAPASLAATVTSASLTVAPLGASAAASLLTFMSTTKTTLGLAAVAIIATLGTVTYEIRVRHAAEATLAIARQDYEVLVAKRRDLAQQAQTAEQETAQLKQAVADARAAATRTAAETTKATAAWDPVTEGKAFLARYPDVKQAFIAMQTASVDLRYSALYKSLGLTPAQIEAFHAIMVPVVTNTIMGQEAKELTFSIGDLSLREDAPRLLRELLGDEGYRKCVEFEQGRSVRQLAVEVASALCFTETPLTAAQSGQLIQILDSNRAQRGRSRYNWDAVLAQARDILSAPQLAALEGRRVIEQSAIGTSSPAKPASPAAPKTSNPSSP